MRARNVSLAFENVSLSRFLATSTNLMVSSLVGSSRQKGLRKGKDLTMRS